MGTISTLLDQIDSGVVLLPEFQRGYIWKRKQICSLMRSLYLGYPVGSLLLWEADARTATTRGEPVDGVRLLLLDGQQRVTTLYGVMRGSPPTFFDGDPDMFRGLYFNLAEERFQFLTREGDCTYGDWVDVTEVFTEGPAAFIDSLRAKSRDTAKVYLNRLTRLSQVAERNLPAEKITGLDQQVDVVVDIFNQVNAGGTQLSKGDLALAKLCAMTPSARQQTRENLGHWSRAGYRFSQDWLLRNITAVATGRGSLAALDAVTPEAFERAMTATPAYVDYLLKTMASVLGLDNDRVLPGRSWFPVGCRLLHRSGGEFRTDAERDRFLYWAMLTAIRGRFSSSLETMLGRDLKVADGDGVDGLLAELEHWIDGGLAIGPGDFDCSYNRARVYPLLHIIGRNAGSNGTADGTAHSIFPRAVLRDIGFPAHYINALANRCIDFASVLTRDRDGTPDTYLDQIEQRSPGFLDAQCIPRDRRLWRTERFADFLHERRILLTASAQAILDDLRYATRPRSTVA